jgi:indole-3-glycerol phosphate synthase
VTGILGQIVAEKRREVERRQSVRAFEELLDTARSAAAPRGFKRALAAAVEAGGYGLIAEIKKASPSAGPIRKDFDPAGLARAYERGGAACLSVLTDMPYFQGGDKDLAAARGAAALPVLRKDFIVDPYQIAESRALGADCVLLILAVLDDAMAQSCATAARDLGMDTLIEVHNEAELDRARALGFRFIGINNRDLRSFRTDLATTERLAQRAPAGARLVAESGLKTSADLARLARAGVSCFLVGESLLRQADVEAATRALLSPPPDRAKHKEDVR